MNVQCAGRVGLSSFCSRVRSFLSFSCRESHSLSTSFPSAAAFLGLLSVGLLAAQISAVEGGWFVGVDPVTKDDIAWYGTLSTCLDMPSPNTSLSNHTVHVCKVSAVQVVFAGVRRAVVFFSFICVCFCFAFICLCFFLVDSLFVCLFACSVCLICLLLVFTSRSLCCFGYPSHTSLSVSVLFSSSAQLTQNDDSHARCVC